MCVSFPSGALLLLTPLSAPVECISYRGGAVEGEGGRGSTLTIQAYQTPSDAIRPVTQDRRENTHTKPKTD